MDVEHYRKPVSHGYRGIARIGGDLQVRRRDLGSCDCRIGFLAQLDHQARNRIALDVIIFEKPLLDAALRVQDESAGERNTEHDGIYSTGRNIFSKLSLKLRIVL